MNEKNQEEEKNKVQFSEKLKHIHNISDLHQELNQNNLKSDSKFREVISSSFTNNRLPEKSVIESNFGNYGKNLLMIDTKIKNEVPGQIKNLTSRLNFDINDYIIKRPEGLENTKTLLTNFEKITHGEEPKLMPLQSFTSNHLQELMAPIVEAVHSNTKKMKKMDEQIEKKEKLKENMIEKIMLKQNEIINFMVNKTEEKKNKKIKLKYKELQKELDRVELGLSPDFSKFNILNEELNYMLNKEAEEKSFFFII